MGRGRRAARRWCPVGRTERPLRSIIVRLPPPAREKKRELTQETCCLQSSQHVSRQEVVDCLRDLGRLLLVRRDVFDREGEADGAFFFQCDGLQLDGGP